MALAAWSAGFSPYPSRMRGSSALLGGIPVSLRVPVRSGPAPDAGPARPENLMCGRNWARAETLCGGRIAVASLAGPWTKCRDVVELHALLPLHLGGLPTRVCQWVGQRRTGWPAGPPSSRLSNSRPFMRQCCFRRAAGGLLREIRLGLFGAAGGRTPR